MLGETCGQSLTVKWEVEEAILGAPGSRSKIPINFFPVRQCYMTLSCSISMTWIGMKLSWSNHQFKRLQTALSKCTSLSG